MKRTVTAVTLDPTGEYVLLLRREDFRVWALPSGHVEEAEDPRAAIEREIREETGFVAAVERLVGTYYQPQFDDAEEVYLAHAKVPPEGPPGPEARDVRWMPRANLPRPLFFHTRRFVDDAFASFPEPLNVRLEVAPRDALLLKLGLALRSLRNRVFGDPNERAGRHKH